MIQLGGCQKTFRYLYAFFLQPLIPGLRVPELISKKRYKTQSTLGRISSLRQWLVSRSGVPPAPVQNDQLTEEEKKNA